MKYRIFLIRFILIVIAACLVGWQTRVVNVRAGEKVSRGRKITRPPSRHVDTARVLAAPYYSLLHDMTATLMLSNRGPHPMEVRVSLFNLAGERFDVSMLTMKAETMSSFDVKEFAQMAGDSFAEGSIQVSYMGMPMELAGLVKLLNAKQSLIFEEELTEPIRMFASSRLEGVWWLRSSKTELRLILSNMTDEAVDVSLGISQASHSEESNDAEAQEEKSNNKHQETLSLSSHETRVLNLRKVINKHGKGIPQIGGISVKHSGPKGGVLALGLIQEPEAGFSNIMEFQDPKMAKSSRLDGTGLRFGQIAGERLTQMAVARNVGDSQIVLKGRIAYTQKNGAQSVTPLPDMNLAPGEIRQIDLAAAIGQIDTARGISLGLEFEHSGTPGSVVMSAVSVSHSGNHVFRVALVDASSLMGSAGTYPWSIDNTSSSFVYIKNITDVQQRYSMTIGFDGGSYHLGLKAIAPGETVVFDLRKLRDDQVPDVDGKPMPLDAAGGQVHWSIYGGRKELIGRGEHVDIAHGTSMTYACGCCPNAFMNGWIEPWAVIGSVGDSSQFVAKEQQQTCYGSGSDTLTVNPDWGTDNPSVASCNNSGLATAVGPGSTNITADWWSYYFIPNNNDPPDCISQPVHVYPTASCDVRPTISGPDTVWYFEGQTPSGYQTSITLTSSGGAGTSWNVTNGANKVNLSSTSGSQINVTSSGTSFSGSPSDITITATVSSATSYPFNITTRKPYQLVSPQTIHNCDSSFGYLDTISYAIQDQLLTSLPSAVPWNEKFTTACTQDNPQGNWCSYGLPAQVGDVATFVVDHISGPGVNNNPQPVPRPVCVGDNTQQQHWGQEFRVGALSPPGTGVRVQTNTLVRFTNHGEHQNRTSPTP